MGKSGVGKTNLIDTVCGLKNTKSSNWEIIFDKSNKRKLNSDIGAIQLRKISPMCRKIVSCLK